LNQKFMKRAIELAKKGAGWTNPNPLVGAVIVKDGEIIGEGWHEKIGGLHAERNALKNCQKSPKGAEIYVTLEPCCHYGKTPPCTEALIENGIGKVYVGNLDPNPKVAGKGIQILRDHGIEVVTGVMEEECSKLNDIFFHYIKEEIPYVALKYAMTMDGKIATSAGESQWITGETAREHVHQLRHRYAAIMVGIGTVLADDPMLNARVENGHDPVRVICDSNLRIPTECQIVKTAGKIPTIIATLSEDAKKTEQLEKAGCLVWKPKEAGGHIDLRNLFEMLHREEIDSVLVEGGGILNEAVIKSGCVSKAYVYIAPKIFGGSKAKTPVEGDGISKIKDALYLKDLTCRMLGDDILLEGKVKSCLPEL
jgi:diaminohydroxyphosphoribosylaminopyrimidine deaminase/5-amino-6-(5-phosphoribosylamino)uracil reductase